ncbi:MAG: hypothetical protein F4X44_09725 [Gammaproteobacteria bacterium]|nr:hypothetical protein [Gammaproteobacteria bacterium]MYD80876.1 hypothetical protein [Gammaproteobacteria bacterium]
MRKLLATLTVVLGTATLAQDHFLLGSFGYSHPSFDEIGGSAQVFSGGLGYHGFFENGLYLGANYAYDRGEGNDCNFFPCIDAVLEKRDVGAYFGFQFNVFTPFVSVHSSTPIWDTTEILRSFGRDREEKVMDYGIGTWVDGGGAMPNLWLRFSADGIEKNKGIERSLTGMGIYRLRKNLVVGAKFSLFIADEDRGSKTSLVLGWRF